MPLRTSETAQCKCCEEYMRLSEVVGAKIAKDGTVKLNRRKHADRGGFIGNCPACGEPICQYDIG